MLEHKSFWFYIVMKTTIDYLGSNILLCYADQICSTVKKYAILLLK